MDSADEELYLQKLQEFIYDEDKIVTYSWLSNKLDLDATTCKNLLKTFLNDQRSLKPAELAASYYLVGTLKENNNNVVLVVKEDDLEQKKKDFKHVSMECIYSIQKMKDFDMNLLSMVDMLNINAPRNKPMLGAIIGKNCIKRNLKEKKPMPVLNRAASTDKSKASHLFKKVAPVEKEVVKQEPKETLPNINAAQKSTNKEIVKNTKSEVKAKPSQKSGIQNFFSKAPLKSETKIDSKPVFEDEQMDVDETAKIKKNTLCDSDTDEEAKIVEDKNKTVETKKKILYDSDTDEEAKKIEEKNKKKNANSSAKKKKPATKRARNDKSMERPQKRRKRIVEKNDSDSDDMFASEGDEDEERQVELSDDEPVYKKPVEKILAPKNKKRKLVDKTYEDEEGYIVTKKEWVIQSGSEEEEEEDKEQKNPQFEKKLEKKLPIEKQPSMEKPTKNEISPVKGAKGKKAKVVPTNQPTMMSFFKKK